MPLGLSGKLSPGVPASRFTINAWGLGLAGMVLRAGFDTRLRDNGARRVLPLSPSSPRVGEAMDIGRYAPEIGFGC